MERVNFVARELSDVNKPGIRSIIDRLTQENNGQLTPEQLVDRCLELIGPMEVSDSSRNTLVGYARRQGNLNLQGHKVGDEAEQRVGNILRLMASTREFQLA